MVNPLAPPDQFAEITYDHDPGTSGWVGVMTRMQGSTNGSGYLAFAYAGAVWLYRVDDNGWLHWNGLTSANVDVSVAPRQLRLESQGSTHRVIFNGVLLITYTDTNNVYTAGQPGIAVSSFSTILSFSGGALTTYASAECRAADWSAAGDDEPNDAEPDHGRECDLPVCDHSWSGVQFDGEHFQQHRRHGALDAPDRAGKRQQLQLLRSLSGRCGKRQFL